MIRIDAKAGRVTNRWGLEAPADVGFRFPSVDADGDEIWVSWGPVAWQIDTP